MPWYEYDDDQGLDSLARKMPATDQDLVERVEWPLVAGIVTEKMAEEPPELEAGESALSLDPRFPHESRVSLDAVDEVHGDITRVFNEKHKNDVEWDLDEPGFKTVGVFEARWVKQKGRWRLTRYDFDLDVDPSTEYPRYDVDEEEFAEA